MNELTKKAISFAIEKHEGQFRKGSGLPYITHPIEVYSIVKKYKDSRVIDELCAAAVLHDVVEDCGVSIQNLSEEFTPLISSLVSELTNDEEEIRKISKRKYMLKKVMNLTSWALVIKLADMIANTSDQPNKKAVLRTKYILQELMKHRKMSKTQWRMCFELERIIQEIHLYD